MWVRVPPSLPRDKMKKYDEAGNPIVTVPVWKVLLGIGIWLSIMLISAKIVYGIWFPIWTPEIIKPLFGG